MDPAALVLEPTRKIPFIGPPTERMARRAVPLFINPRWLTTRIRWLPSRKLGLWRLVGVTFNDRPQNIYRANEGDNAVLRRMPTNPFGKNAIEVFVRGRSVGSIDTETCAWLAPQVDGGELRIGGSVHRRWSFVPDEEQGMVRPREIQMIEIEVWKLSAEPEEVFSPSRFLFWSCVAAAAWGGRLTLSGGRQIDWMLQRLAGDDRALHLIFRCVAIVVAVFSLGAAVLFLVR
jgi:hypothetical protein